VLDARFFAAEDTPVIANWVLTGKEREFNYGNAGDDVFAGLFEVQQTQPVLVNGIKGEACLRDTESTAQNIFDVHHRFNFLLVNVFRGHFLRGPWSAKRRHQYSEAAKHIFRPSDAAFRARDEALASVTRDSNAPLIGVHKRVDNPGTARMQLSQQMPNIDAYINAVQALAKQRGAADTAVIVLATDDEQAVLRFHDAFPQRVICRQEARRCRGGINENKLPVEVHGQATRLSIQDALDCLVDAMLLAACDTFIHADSNVTIAAGIMNPKAEAIHVHDLVPDAGCGGAWPGYRRCRLPI